ncbi:BspA family leucine-rich repeat surface protein [Chryseobacterium sp. Ch-15]|uniref:BspA family leucine-rich repeat surface protein n=1 Tax=Chryseobacterium muglaense TaxID=2893752 RepID=A0A9Q3UUT5_9FLAO|nr:BspA family leucine-rich repeat surface protein [Chryseobacterium muglaense]MBD3906520.1 BspA family leucine-rich repeat surface protein [Chryseobacterium muglaense]MCC9034181.1 BspA family leucine-rich repeat surface protein [Chryseobacterium muglaense]MCM2556272.1 BspA family leucine-rich repeat surface protein [Chryseobacterium muglaense]
MCKKLLLFISLIFFQIANAQNEFITIWKPGITSTPVVSVNAPFQANSNQIWFPGTGQNYTIRWEEIGFPQHFGVMENVTSTGQILIDFGTPSKEDGANTSYRVKVSNGNGVFQQIKFATYQIFGNADALLPILQMQGSADKLLTIEQWGNIEWISMSSAFANCQRVDITAIDSPNLSQVTDASLMFYRANSFSGGSFMQNWDTSTIQNFSFMFALQHIGQVYSPDLINFNPPNLNNWDVSSATNLSFMFAGRSAFNQNINSWNVANVKNTAWMFTACGSYNQPLNSWNTSNFENINNMFSVTALFNQPLDNWDTSKVTNMNGTFSSSQNFNQPLEIWDVSRVKKMGSMFGNAQSFNQSLGNWDLSSLESAGGIFTSSGINCENYSKTLKGWAENPNTPDNVSLTNLLPMQYAANVTSNRDFLINKGWTFSGDVLGSCTLKINETAFSNQINIYPNPASDILYIKNAKDVKSFIITDFSGRIVLKNNLVKDFINIQSLSTGNYILQLITTKNIENFKFIKQ